MATSVASGSSTDLDHPTKQGKLKVTRSVNTFVKSFYTRHNRADDGAFTIRIYFDFQDVSSDSGSSSDSDDSTYDFDSMNELQVPVSNWGERETSSDDDDYSHLDAESILQRLSQKKSKPSYVIQAAEKYAKTRLGLKPKGKKKKKKNKKAAQNETKEEKEGRLKFETALKLFQGPAKKLDVYIPWLPGKLETGMIVDEAEAKRAQEAMFQERKTLSVVYKLPGESKEGAVGGVTAEETSDTTTLPYLVLPEISPSVYSMLFQGYMSTGRLPFLDYSLSWDLLKLAKMYNFPEPVLDEIRGHLFQEAWMESKCWVAYQEACNQNEQHLKDLALMAIIGKFNDCSDDREFLYLEPEQLLTIVQIDCCVFEENKIFQNCIKWARSRAARTIPGTDLVETINYPTFQMINYCQSDEEDSETPEHLVDQKLVRKYMKPLLPHIRLFSMPVGVLRMLLMASKIFRLSEIEMLCNPDSDNPKTKDFRNFFSPLTTPRTNKPEVKQIFVYGYPEKAKIGSCSFMAYSPYQIWSCDFPLINFRLKQLSHVTVHCHTQLKPDDKGETYQEKFRLVLCTSGDRREVRHASEVFSVMAKYNSYVKVQFKLPEVTQVHELETELFVVYHCTGPYPMKDPWLAIEGQQEGADEPTNEECNIL